LFASWNAGFSKKKEERNQVSKRGGKDDRRGE